MVAEVISSDYPASSGNSNTGGNGKVFRFRLDCRYFCFRFGDFSHPGDSFADTRDCSAATLASRLFDKDTLNALQMEALEFLAYGF